MADNTTLNTGSGGDVIATDDIAGVKFQRVKIVEGADGVNDGDISSANPLPVTATGAAAHGAAVSGNPVLKGLEARTTLPTAIDDASETTLIAAGAAGVFRDLVQLIISNGDTALRRIDIKDATAGTIRASFYAAASGGGYVVSFAVPLKQATAANNWTATLDGAVGANNVKITAIAVERG